MTTIATAFVGCKVSQADGEEALAGLAEAGLRPAVSRDAADVVVVHTCCVTAEAERKSRRLVRRAAAAGSRVVVAGCAAALRPEQFAAEGVVVTADPDWRELAGELGRGSGADGEGLAARAGARTRQVVKIQDGCSGACAYCVIRLVRGNPRSLAMDEVLARARGGVENGCGEVVLSGIDLGAWRDGDAGLPELVREVAALDGLRRVRLSSLEPRHVTPELLSLLDHPRVARHLHVPLQSADDGVLAAMRRPYTFAEYTAALAGLRGASGGPAGAPSPMLSTDVIVGYPTEDEQAFSRTLAALESGQFGRVHVFAFSARPGTEAAALRPLPPGVVKERMGRALAAAEAAALSARRAALGRPAEILVEERRDGLWRGYSSEYIRYALRGIARRGELVRAVADEVGDDGVVGTVEE